MKRKESPIILALDTDDIDIALKWIEVTKGSVDIYKVGLEFFLKHGAEGLRELRETQIFELFLDLKLHDIPNTVAGAVRAVSDLKPRFLTVHASGGAPMIEAATKAAPEIAIAGVTVLTSLEAKELSAMGIALTPLDLALSLARVAVASGAKAIVCSPIEVAEIRQAVGNEVKIIAPGVRPVDSEVGDQSRVMTPREAIISGADFLVIGRPITSYFAQSAMAMQERALQILETLA